MGRCAGILDKLRLGNKTHIVNHNQFRPVLKFALVGVMVTLLAGTTAFASTKKTGPGHSKKPVPTSGSGSGSTVHKVPPSHNQGPVNLPPY